MAVLASWLGGWGDRPEPRGMTPPGNRAGRAAPDLADPSAHGPGVVRTLTCGSGTDQLREEFGAGIDLRTEPVDGSALLETWTGWRAALRARYWGFGAEALPVNGRVWYPDGEGPFPLVLMVHGNHPMHDFSDPGYAYLGELLASRGFIAVSVDQNFLNVSFLRIFGSWGETDARAWLLLEHLRVWREWSETPGNPFHARIDLDRIALLGHSRGGAAAAVAATFNRLGHDPDDASVSFDYGFGIRAVVGIAPADGQYRPAQRDNPLEGVSYLVLHGSHDGDVFTFMGLRQYNRTRWPDGTDGVKAALYIHRANHGQFNTRWGAGDLAGVYRHFMKLGSLLSGEQQRRVAGVAIAAFLEATLRDRPELLPVLRDPRIARAWLPDTLILSQTASSADRRLCTFEEDLDLTTTTEPGGRQRGEGLAVWREQEIEARWGTFQNSAVYVGWQRQAGEPAPRYAVDLPAGLARRWRLDSEAVLFFSLADADEALPDEEEPTLEDVDLTLEVVDAAGSRAALPLHHFSVLPHAVLAQERKSRAMLWRKRSEPVFLTLEFPLRDFTEANPDFDPASLAALEFVFDRTPSGLVLLDEVGFRPGP
jgi:dienelactone hydrolase